MKQPKKQKFARPLQKHLVSFILLASFLCLAPLKHAVADDYIALWVEPKNVGTFASLGQQQFFCYGQLPNGDWTKSPINDEVDWYVEANPFSTQTTAPGDIVSVDENGLATIHQNITWGRLNVAACYPKGCAPKGNGDSGDSSFIMPVIIKALFKAPLYYILDVSVDSGAGVVVDTSSREMTIDCDENGETTCSAQYRKGANVTLSITPGAARGVTGSWSGDCAGAANDANCSLAMDGDKTVGADFSALSDYTVAVTVVDPGGTVSASLDPITTCNSENSQCFGTYYQGETLTLTTTLGRGYTHGTWSGDCANFATTDVPCDLTIDDDKNVTAAAFGTLDSYRLSVEVIGGGSVSADLDPLTTCDAASIPCAGNYFQGEVVTLTASTVAGFDAGTWSGDGCSGSAANPCQVTMDQARNVTVTFAALPEYTLTVTDPVATGNVTSLPAGINCGNGSSVCGETYYEGDSLILTATPASGYAHGSWSGGDCSGTTVVPCPITMDAAKTVSASFNVETGNALTVTVNTSGLLSAGVYSEPNIVCGVLLGNPLSACNHTYSADEVVTLTAAATGGSLQEWSGNCISEDGGDPNVATVTMDSPKTCIATFISD